MLIILNQGHAKRKGKHAKVIIDGTYSCKNCLTNHMPFSEYEFREVCLP